MGLASVDKALSILHQKRVPNFAFPERAASALAAMVARKRWLDMPPSTSARIDGVDRAAAAESLLHVDFDGMLASYGIPIAYSRLARDAAEAVNIAGEIGYPVALKIASPDVTHKSDIGGVRLNLRNAHDVRQAFDQVAAGARSSLSPARINGVFVQKMYPAGQELIVGVRRDNQFGPLILVGSGGTEVELLRDVRTSIAPLTYEGAGRLLDQTRAGVRMKGWRGMPAGDRTAALDSIVRLSLLAADFSEISEIEINPLLVLPEGKGVVGLDVRGVVAQKGGS